MTLDTRAPYPSEKCYVLKLHRDALPDQGNFKGRLEHIASGAHVDFHNSLEMLAWLTQHAYVFQAEHQRL